MLAHSELVSDRSVAFWSSQLPDCNSYPLLHRQGGSQSHFITMLSLVHLCTFFLHSFKIDFQCGSCPSPDIAFHFNPRFEEGGCVVCNTCESQNWGREERKDEMPFLKGYPFEIRVLVKHDSFQVAVNGNPFVQYKHRIPLSKVNCLSVSGGVDVAIIRFEDTAVSADCMYYCVSEPRGEMEKL
uniref:Galectin n=1 Tax=Chrysemys picta bellii TaxID=8478 RepID=A0A8C3HKJ4_CHRPI